MLFFQIKYMHDLWSGSSAAEYICKEIPTNVCKWTCRRMCTAALIVVAEYWEVTGHYHCDSSLSIAGSEWVK